MIKEKIKNKAKSKLKKYVLLFLQPLIIPIIIIFFIFVLVSYITDIFYIGIKNEDKSNMKEEIKYYTDSEYTKEDSESFFGSVGEFIAGIFTKNETEIVSDASWPVQGKSSKDITSFYGYRKAPTSRSFNFSQSELTLLHQKELN